MVVQGSNSLKARVKEAFSEHFIVPYLCHTYDRSLETESPESRRLRLYHALHKTNGHPEIVERAAHEAVRLASLPPGQGGTSAALELASHAFEYSNGSARAIALYTDVGAAIAQHQKPAAMNSFCSHTRRIIGDARRADFVLTGVDTILAEKIVGEENMDILKRHLAQVREEESQAEAEVNAAPVGVWGLRLVVNNR